MGKAKLPTETRRAGGGRGTHIRRASKLNEVEHESLFPMGYRPAGTYEDPRCPLVVRQDSTGLDELGLTWRSASWKICADLQDRW